MQRPRGRCSRRFSPTRRRLLWEASQRALPGRTGVPESLPLQPAHSRTAWTQHSSPSLLTCCKLSSTSPAPSWGALQKGGYRLPPLRCCFPGVGTGRSPGGIRIGRGQGSKLPFTSQAWVSGVEGLPIQPDLHPDPRGTFQASLLCLGFFLCSSGIIQHLPLRAAGRNS